MSAETGPLQLLARARCGACGGPSSGLNLVVLPRVATWRYPTAFNVLPGRDANLAVAVVCDACIRSQSPTREAVELRDGELHYHAVSCLQPLGMVQQRGTA